MDSAAVLIDTDVDLNIAFINLGQALGSAAKTVIHVFATIFSGGLKSCPLPEFPEQILGAFCKK
jgi:hypothetical protein